MDNLKRETIKRPMDECPCDWCSDPLYVGDSISIDLDHGTDYCCRACAQQDAFDRGNGPVCPGVSRW